MRNGELDGYRAKLVVLQAHGDDDTVISNGKFDDYVAQYAGIIARFVRASLRPDSAVRFFPRSAVHAGGARPTPRSARSATTTPFSSSI
jgi:hypothetical protein